MRSPWQKFANLAATIGRNLSEVTTHQGTMISSVDTSTPFVAGGLSSSASVAVRPRGGPVPEDEATNDNPTTRPAAVPDRPNSESSAATSEASTESAAYGRAASGFQLTDQEINIVRELAARDREVRIHEQAHASVGGQHAGSPSYSYTRGPDGQQYAVGGEVPIDTAPIPGDPEATIAKAQLVRRAALAPAQPSPQDRAVAAEATAIEQQARAELLAQQSEEVDSSAAEGPSSNRFAADGDGQVPQAKGNADGANASSAPSALTVDALAGYDAAQRAGGDSQQGSPLGALGIGIKA